MNEYSDFRSDTTTHPTPQMRKAMAEAVVGDDVIGFDPTVEKLEAMAAGMFGKEALRSSLGSHPGPFHPTGEPWIRRWWNLSYGNRRFQILERR